MNRFRQLSAVAALSFANMNQRIWPSLVAVFGIACVVGVLLSMLSVTSGLS